MSKKYAIIDVETTGGRANRDRITEIAIVIHDGEKILDKFESLLNPGRSIPWNITKLTGISDEMVADAPRFYEVAKRVVEMTKGAIFVAHNVRFDYNFIREEFKRLGYSYSRKQLCTVRMSRKAFPELKRHSLSHLCKALNIPNDARHRAMGDTMATVILFEKILARGQNENIKDMVNLGVKESQLPQNISLEFLHGLPEACGVYYFYDVNGEVIYVGKSINIKKRVMEHFAAQTRKGAKMQQQVDDISYEITGSELVALLLESHEIKRIQPRINRAQRAKSYPYIIYQYKNEAAYTCFGVVKVSNKTKGQFDVVAEFARGTSANAYMHRIVEQFDLCRCLCSMTTNVPGRCFELQIGKCTGAASGLETVEVYNEKALEAIDALQHSFNDSFLLLEEGREQKERALVLVENGIYKGFGFLDMEWSNGSLEEMLDAIQPYEHNKDTMSIIRNYTKKNNMKVISL